MNTSDALPISSPQTDESGSELYVCCSPKTRFTFADLMYSRMSIVGMVSGFCKGLQTHSVLEATVPQVNDALATVVEGVQAGTFDFLFM